MFSSLFLSLNEAEGVKPAGSSIYGYSSPVSVEDTVYIRIPEGTMSGIVVDIPVTASSPDTIHAIDFSFRYNPQDLSVDSIINLTPGLQYLYHFYTYDSVFRFTSNSLTPLQNDSVILLIRFRTFTGQICSPDLDSLITYINGDVCNYETGGCIISGLHEISESDHQVSVYPNPATSELFVISENIICIEIYSATGILIQTEKYSEPENVRIDLDQITNSGIYFVKVISQHFSQTEKVFLLR